MDMFLNLCRAEILSTSCLCCEYTRACVLCTYGGGVGGLRVWVKVLVVYVFNATHPSNAVSTQIYFCFCVTLRNTLVLSVATSGHRFIIHALWHKCHRDVQWVKYDGSKSAIHFVGSAGGHVKWGKECPLPHAHILTTFECSALPFGIRFCMLVG